MGITGLGSDIMVAADSTGDTLTGVVIIRTGAKGVAAGAVHGLTLRCNGAGLSPAKSLATVPDLSAQPSL